MTVPGLFRWAIRKNSEDFRGNVRLARFLTCLLQETLALEHVYTGGLWSAATCRRFGITRRPEGRSQSGDKSPHSKGYGLAGGLVCFGGGGGVSDGSSSSPTSSITLSSAPNF